MNVKKSWSDRTGWLVEGHMPTEITEAVVVLKPLPHSKERLTTTEGRKLAIEIIAACDFADGLS